LTPERPDRTAGNANEEQAPPSGASSSLKIANGAAPFRSQLLAAVPANACHGEDAARELTTTERKQIFLGGGISGRIRSRVARQ
jgi:hypothetical protein